MTIVRPAKTGDLGSVATIQAASPEAAQWRLPSDAAYELLVAEVDHSVAGFIVLQRVDQEGEILNLAVSQKMRRKGVGRALVEACMERCPDGVFLEVRESNEAARKFYNSIGFKEMGRRRSYYNSPPEDAIVMKFHSC